MMSQTKESLLLPPREHGVMERGSFFGKMNYNRLARLLSDHELNFSRQSQCGESVVRCCSFMQFCCVSLLSLVTVMTPWMLSAAELVITLVIYFTVVPESMKTLKESPDLSDSDITTSENLKDILICSIVRVVLLSISYAFAFSRYHPYYIIAWLTSIVLIPYAIFKAVFTVMNPVGRSLALILTLILFSIVHLVVAHATKKRLQKRHNLGLPGFDSSWDEENWVMSGALDTSSTNDAIQDLFLAGDDDIPRDILKDGDSKFVDCGGLSVHYKEEYPTIQGQEEGTAVLTETSFALLLIHGYGGGVFAWRHLMKPLAEICQCRVVAFDRPAFGLTSRPKVDDPSNNPYTTQSLHRLILEFCGTIGIHKAVIAAHSDGCISALMLGAALNPLNSNIPRRVSEKVRKMLRVKSSTKKEEEPLMIGLPIRRTNSEVHDTSESTTLEEGLLFNSDSGKSSTMDAVMHPNHASGLSILAMVFLHPDLSCDEGPALTHLLKQSKIARKVLRPLLRSDIGEVSNRRAWYDTTKLTKEILELYKAPLRIRGWDSALIAYTKERKTVTSEDIRFLMQRVVGLPSLVLSGEKDRIVPPEKATAIADELHAEHRAVLPNCGHLSHEEVPSTLLDRLVTYIRHISELYEDL